MLLLGFVSRENSNLRLASSDVNLTEVFSRYQRRHYGGDTDDDQGDNHRLMLLHCSLLLDLTVSKRHSTCVQHIGGLGVVLTPKSWTVKHEAYRSDSDIQLESDLLISG